jgi:hypothetical protein
MTRPAQRSSGVLEFLFLLDNQLLLAYSNLWVKGRPIPVTPASLLASFYFTPGNAILMNGV